MERASFQSDPERQSGPAPARSGDRLDAERAASMADEGGAAAALTDALEQEGHSAGALAPQRRQLPRWLTWAVAGAGLAGVLLALLRRR